MTIAQDKITKAFNIYNETQTTDIKKISKESWCSIWKIRIEFWKAWIKLWTIKRLNNLY